MEAFFPYNRVVVIGTSASGKSTLAKAIAGKTGLEYVELDSLFHGPNWKQTPRDEFVARVRNRMTTERWVIDGNYGNWAGHFQRAELIIWLDYPFRIILSRVLRRTLTRLLTREELWNGNREAWAMAFSRESIVLWVFKTYWRRKREFPVVLGSNSLEHVHKLRFRHPKEATQFLERIPQS